MKLKFEQTPEHIKDLQKKVFMDGRGKAYLIIAIAVIFVYIVGFVLTGFDNNFQDARAALSYEAILSWITPMAVIAIIWYIIVKRINSKFNIQKNNPSSIGPRELDISEENIHYKTNEFTGTFNWSGLTDFKETKLCYYLHIGKNQAIVVPKSAFASNAQEKEFLQIVDNKLKS